jgi:hypothetical protein
MITGANWQTGLLRQLKVSTPFAQRHHWGFQDEVILFWPLLIQLLNLRAQFPVRLRPETEQELATQLWHQSWMRKFGALLG